jgi:hypothetical protein
METKSKNDTRLQTLQAKHINTYAISNTVIKWKEYDESQKTTLLSQVSIELPGMQLLTLGCPAPSFHAVIALYTYY